MHVWERERGCGEAHQPLCCKGWAEVPVIGSVLSCMHTHSIRNPSQSCKDREEDSVARQSWKMRFASYDTMSADRWFSRIDHDHTKLVENADITVRDGTYSVHY